VDARTRTIVVRGPDNVPQTLQLGPEVRNFDQIRRGDRVRVSPTTGSWWGRTFTGMGRVLPA
jgi:hypothetical protein